MFKYQVSAMMETEDTQIIEGELQEYQIKAIQMYKLKLSEIQVMSFFSVPGKCKR